MSGIDVTREANSNRDATAISDVLDRAVTQSGESLVRLSAATPVLLVFLRHTGCTFCREAMVDIAESRHSIERGGIRIVLVHMGDGQALQTLLDKNGIAMLDRICDPERALYRAFGLKRGTFSQLFGLKVLWRGLVEGAVLKCGLGRAINDSHQLPGVFLLGSAGIIRHFRHRSAADRPDYVRFCLEGGSQAE